MDSELQQFFVAPGYYGADVAHVREYEKTRAEFRKIPVSMLGLKGLGLGLGVAARSRRCPWGCGLRC